MTFGEYHQTLVAACNQLAAPDMYRVLRAILDDIDRPGGSIRNIRLQSFSGLREAVRWVEGGVK